MQFAPMRWWHIEKIMPIEQDLFGDDHWSAAAFWSELAQANTRWYQIVLDSTSRLVAYAGLCIYGEPGAGEAWIQTIAVARGVQSQGIGTSLLQALINQAHICSATSLNLEVRADNVAAQRLYARHGFEAVALRRGYYQPSNTDAVVMAKTLTP